MKKSLVALTLFTLPLLATQSFAQEYTPFENAVRSNNVVAAQKIAAAPDFNPNAKSALGNYPLQFTISLNRAAISKMLIQNPKTDVNLVSEIGNESALGDAITINSVPIMTALLANPKTNVNLPVGDEESPPLQSAMAQNRLGIFKLLLADKRTKVDAKNQNGYTVLHEAASLDFPEFMKAALVTRKVDVNAINKDKTAPIHLAAKCSPNCLKLLLASPKIKANLLDGEGHSAVYYGAFENPDSLKLLVKSPKVKLSVKDKAAIKDANKPRHGDSG